MRTMIDVTDASPDQLAALQALGFGQAPTMAMVEPAAEPTHPFMVKVARYRGQGGRRQKFGRTLPLFKVNTIKGERGVFLVTEDLVVYSCKINADGSCHKPGRFDGSWHQHAAELIQYNQHG